MHEPTGGVSNGTEFVCEICGATFESDESLGRHIYEAGLVS